MKQNKLPIVIELNAFELGQIMGGLDIKKIKNFTPNFKRKLTRTVNKMYKKTTTKS